MKLSITFSIAIGFCVNLFAQNHSQILTEVPNQRTEEYAIQSNLFPNSVNPMRSLATLPNIGIWIDSLNVGFGDIKKKQNYKQIDSSFIFDNTAYAYWFRFSLKNETAAEKNYWLNTSVFDSLTLIQSTPKGKYIQHRGLLIAYNQLEKSKFKSLEEDKYGFLLYLKPQSSTEFFLRIKNIVRFESTFKEIQLIPSANQNRRAIIWSLIFNCVFIGILTFLALFSLLQFFQNKDLAYFFYFLYLTTCNIYMWWKFEKANSFVNLFFTNLPEWYYFIETPVYLAIYISYLLFLVYFIDAKKDIPFFYKLMKITIISIPTYLILDRILIHFVGFSFSWQLYFIFRVILVSAGLITLYFVFKSKAKLTIYLLSGSFVVLVGSCITAYYSKTMTQHYWNNWDIPLIPIQIAILIEVLLFSIGLGYKSRLAERERTEILQNLKIERKEKENQKKQKEQLTNWFSNVSHEFRTPLTIINGLTQQIQERPNFKLRERLRYIKNNTKNLLDLINQLLDLSKLEAGHISLNYQQQDIIPYLRFLTESFQSIAFDKKVMLSFYADKETFWMDFDIEKMKRIVVNLVTNALKFTPEYGGIMVEAKFLSQSDLTEIMDFIQNKNSVGNYLNISSLAKEKGLFLSLKIKDSGKGIDAKNLQYIFDRFYQANPDNQLQKGTGLGLALVKELVLLMQGAILVKSTLNEGTSMTIILPVIQQRERVNSMNKKENTAIKKPIPLHKTVEKEPMLLNGQARILIVEDSKDVIYYLKACLDEKYQLWTARNGEEGLKKATQSLPDLIISDVMMPKMNGFDLCQQLKKDHRTAHIPIILLTARTQKADVHKGLMYGADAYLTKPFNQEELYLRIENLLSIREKVKAQIMEVQPANAASEADVQFLEKLQTIILENLHQEDFNTHQLCRALATSRSQLHRKLKTLTDYSTADYIRHIRLQKAKVLLITTQLPIGEISSKVGFKTQAHFSRTYLKEFGQTPSDTRK